MKFQQQGRRAKWTMAPFSMMILHRAHVHTRTSLTYVCGIQDTCADLRTKASPSVRGMDWTGGLDWCFGLQSGLVTTSPVRNPTREAGAALSAIRTSRR